MQGSLAAQNIGARLDRLLMASVVRRSPVRFFADFVSGFMVVYPFESLSASTEGSQPGVYLQVGLVL